MARVQLSPRQHSPPDFIYSTRSSSGKPLNLTTDLALDPIYTNTSTPTTSITIQSTDQRLSPTSSRTSISTAESAFKTLPMFRTTKMSPDSSTSDPNNGDSQTIQISTDVSIEQPKRPGRLRKPTQKAVDIVASGDSNLFSHIKEQQLDWSGDAVQSEAVNQPQRASKGEEDSETSEHHTCLEAQIPNLDARQTSLTATNTESSLGPSSSIHTPTHAPMQASREASAESLKRKHAEESEETYQRSPKQIKITDTRPTRSKSKTPALGTIIEAPITENAATATVKSSRKRKKTVESDETVGTSPKKLKTKDIRTTRSLSKTPAPVIIPQDQMPQQDTAAAATIKKSRKRKHMGETVNLTANDVEMQPVKKLKKDIPASRDTEIQPVSPRKRRSKLQLSAKTNGDLKTNVKGVPTETTPNSRRFEALSPKPKSKPRPSLIVTLKYRKPASTPSSSDVSIVIPTVSTALEGKSGLPCSLSCLDSPELLYTMSAFVVDNGDLSETMIKWPETYGKEFEQDFGDEASLVRCRYNIVMAEFCVCGESWAVREGWQEEVNDRSSDDDDDYGEEEEGDG